MDIDNTTVTMSLRDFEELRDYKKSYKKLISDIRSFAYIDLMTSDGIEVAIKKDKAEKFLVPLAAVDCEVDGYPEEENIKVTWK